MSPILHLAIKDLRLLAADRMSMFFILGFPVIYGVFFGAIFGSMGEETPGSVPVAVVDLDETDWSRRFVEALRDNEVLAVSTMEPEPAADAVRRGQIVAYLELPEGFGETAGIPWAADPATVRLGVDPARKAEAGMLQGYIMQATGLLMQERFTDTQSMRDQLTAAREQINAEDSGLPLTQRVVLSTFLAAADRFFAEFDPEMMASEDAPDFEPVSIETVDVVRTRSAAEEAVDQLRSPYEISFPSAMLWGVLSCAGGFAASIARERQQGTFLRLSIAPISRAHLLAGKALACGLAIVGVLAFMLMVGRLGFGLRFTNPLGLAIACVATAVGFVGLMMFFATLADSEQAVIGASWSFFVLAAMFGGGMIPLAFMPSFMAALSDFSPVKWAILALEGGTWRQFSLVEMARPVGVLVGMGVVAFALGVLMLRRRSAAG